MQRWLRRLSPREPTQRGETAGTAFFQASVSSRHEELGAGCRMRLTLPATVAAASASAARRQAEALNWIEATTFARVHHLGRWYVGGMGLCHEVFLPAVSYAPGMFANLYLTDVLRAAWAGAHLVGLQSAGK